LFENIYFMIRAEVSNTPLRATRRLAISFILLIELFDLAFPLGQRHRTAGKICQFLFDRPAGLSGDLDGLGIPPSGRLINTIVLSSTYPGF
jgi:hypothetical protein